MSARDFSEITAAGIDHWKSLPLDPARLERAKKAYTTRRVDFAAARQLLRGSIIPQAGDLMLARVERIGAITRLELASGRHAALRVRDEIVVACGPQQGPQGYAPNLHGYLGLSDLVSAGGVAAACAVTPAPMGQATRIRPVGLLADGSGARLGMQRWALPEVRAVGGTPTLIAVVGTAAGVGKTAAVTDLVHGYRQLGLGVGVARITGTGAGDDRWAALDAGAAEALDFTDMGVPSTLGLSRQRLERIFTCLTGHLAAAGCDVILVEIADGLLQREAAELLESEVFRDRCDGAFVAAGDAFGAAAAVSSLRQQGFTVFAAGGAMTGLSHATPRASRIIPVPVVSAAGLSSGRWLPPVRDPDTGLEILQDPPMSAALARLVEGATHAPIGFPASRH